MLLFRANRTVFWCFFQFQMTNGQISQKWWENRMTNSSFAIVSLTPQYILHIACSPHDLQRICFWSPFKPAEARHQGIRTSLKYCLWNSMFGQRTWMRKHRYDTMINGQLFQIIQWIALDWWFTIQYKSIECSISRCSLGQRPPARLRDKYRRGSIQIQNLADK